MGALRDAGGEERVLPCRCLIGRSSLSHLRIEDPIASAEHAVIYWDRRAWRIRDLASRNGTFVNSDRIAPGQSRTVGVGDRIGFGGAHVAWTVSNEEGPQPAATLEGSPGARFGSGGLLLLPDETDPEAAVYARDSRWVVERGGQVAPVESGDRIVLPGGSWVLLLPEFDETGVAATERPPIRMAEITLDFFVSSDEERVQVDLRLGSTCREVRPKACLYLLLTLARHRLASPENEWLHAEDLADRLRCTREKINLDIHRVRRVFEVAGVSDPVEVIQRRETHELRCNGAAITINRR